MQVGAVNSRLLLPTKKLVQALPIRFAGYWNMDWKPGPYPQTAEERKAAAVKYGMLPEDYKPFEDNGTAPGDYPDVTPVYELARSPWEFYDYYPQRRNFNEVLTWHQEIYRGDHYDPYERYNTYRNQSTFRIIASIWGPAFIIAGLICFGEYFKYFEPMKAKQYPFSGEKHYTFEKP